MASDRDSKTYTADSYNKTASFVYSDAYTAPVLSLLDPKPNERIIDFGCGSGEVTLELAKAVGQGGLVVGVDASESMVEKARSNGIAHAFVSDVQALRFPDAWAAPKDGFDAVFTNAALHWCKRDPAGVLRGARAVLKPGGRFVGELGGFTNCIGVRSALHAVLRKRGMDPDALDPWFFPSTADYRSLLESNGFRVEHVSLTPRLTPLTGPLADWLRLFCRNSFLAGVPDADAEEIIAEVQELCRVDCCDSSGNWAMMYTRLRFAAVMA